MPCKLTVTGKARFRSPDPFIFSENAMKAPSTNSLTGTVRQILTAPCDGDTMVSLPQVEAVAGRGLRGDRKYCHDLIPDTDNHVTLIESEKIEDFVAATGLDFSAEDARRNIVTQGIELNALLDQEFYIGSVKVQTVELCEPCSYLAKRTHRAVLWGLANRGGLRCRILTGGIIRVGDTVGLARFDWA